MKTYFINAYGETVKNVIFHSVPYSIVEKGEESFALSRGWMRMPYQTNPKLTKKNIWLQLRLVRINLDKFKWKKEDKELFDKIKQNYSYKIKTQDSLTEEEIVSIKQIFFKYIRHKKYAPNASLEVVREYQLELECNVLDYRVNRKIILYYYKSKPIAFASFEIYQDSVTGLQFAWDYKNPKLHIGLIQNNILADVYKKKGIKYLYLGMSYGKECIYKKRYNGFEFWTGKEWKTSKTEYDKMCRQDSRVKNLDDLELLTDSYIYES